VYHWRNFLKATTFYQYNLAMRNTAKLKPTAFWSQPAPDLNVNSLVLKKKRCHFFLLARTPHGTWMFCHIKANKRHIIIHIYIYIPLTPHPRKGSRGIPEFPPRCPRFTKIIAMRNTADVTGGKHAAWSQSISGTNGINPLIAFYDIHGRKR
jgi:hypothetical protein